MNDMSDTFWVQLFLFLAVVVKIIRDELREIRLAKERLLLKEELHTNTLTTVENFNQVGEVSNKLDSATRETTEHAVEAKKAANFAAERSVVIEEKADSIEKKTDKIEERLNGGDAGLGARVAKNEARLESLEKGQEAIARSVDGLTLTFANFTKRFDKSHPEDRTQVRGESL